MNADLLRQIRYPHTGILYGAKVYANTHSSTYLTKLTTLSIKISRIH